MLQIPNCIKVDRVRNSRLNKRELDEVYKYLRARDGEMCSRCKKSPPQVTLDVHHKDGNKYHHFHKNLEFMCHPCNCQEHQEKKLTGFSLPLTDTQPSPGDTKLYLKKRYLLDFLNYAEEVFTNNDEILYTELITVGAFRCGMASEKTIESYVKLLSCKDPAAPLLRFPDDRTGKEYITLRGGSGGAPPDKVSALFKELRKKYCS